jgi:hypothetical protein
MRIQHTTVDPFKLWVDDVRVYDMERYVEPNSLDMTFQVDKTKDYELWVRYFQSEEGGRIGVRLDNDSPNTLETKDQITGFVWQRLGTFHLKAGEHTIKLENTGGFNAVNTFALIPEEEFSGLEEKIDSLLQGKRMIYILEAESELYSEGAEIYKYGGEASNGEVISLNSLDSRAWQSIDIMKEGDYTMGLRLEGSVIVKVDEELFPVNSPTLDFVYLPPIPLDKGEHTIEIQPVDDEPPYIDVVWLYSTDEDETLTEVFSSPEAPAEITDYQKINDTKYRVKVNASQPFMLAFAEAYDPLWVAKVNGKEYGSQPLYSTTNGFWIEETGELEITIEYKPQQWFRYGAITSGVSLVGALGYVIWDWRRRKGRKGKGSKPESES